MIKDYNEFRQVTINNIQNSGLDIGVIYFILKDILVEVEKAYFAQINKEVLAIQRMAENKPKENDDNATVPLEG